MKIEIIDDEFSNKKRIQYQFRFQDKSYGLMTGTFDSSNPFETLAALKDATELLQNKLVELTR